MMDKKDPVITPQKGKRHEDFTCIKFYPDLAKFKMTHLDEDIVALFTKRAYDLAGVTPSKVSVIFNGDKLEVKDFSSYTDMYLATEEHKDLPKIIEQKHPRWEIIASLSDGQF